MSDRVQAIGRSKAEYAKSIGFCVLSDRGINRVVAFCLFCLGTSCSSFSIFLSWM